MNDRGLQVKRDGEVYDVRRGPGLLWVPFNSILLLLMFLGSRGFVHKFLQMTNEDNNGHLGLGRGGWLMAGMIVGELVVVGLGVVVWRGLMGQRYVFRKDGIEVVRLWVRLPVRRRVFPCDRVYAFGYQAYEHEHAVGGRLRFKADGDEYRVCEGLEELDVYRLLAKLRGAGIEYSAAEEPLERSRTSAHSLLG